MLLPPSQDRVRFMGRLEGKIDLAFLHDDRVFHRILQLPHISGPVVLHQHCEGFRRQRRESLCGLTEYSG